MFNRSAIEPILHPVALKDLRPTQITVGLREVDRKAREWRERKRSESGEWLGEHMIPCVEGPGGHWWLVDHHHLALALIHEGVECALVSVVARLSHLPKRRFFTVMDCHNWLHPYDAEGKRRALEDLPKHLGKLADDPFRSLSGEVRRAGGYAKSATPFTEFLWADFLRDRLRRRQADSASPKVLARAVELARGPDAAYLPGFSGPEPD
jgi:hypothetical protein